jgi:hypothetical protein
MDDAAWRRLAAITAELHQLLTDLVSVVTDAQASLAGGDAQGAADEVPAIAAVIPRINTLTCEWSDLVERS